MKRTLLERIRINGRYYILGALILLLGLPLYQVVILAPRGYNDALSVTNGGRFSAYVHWVGNNVSSFIGYRLLLVVAALCVVSLPFTLFRIIVAQEVLGQEGEREEEAQPQGEDLLQSWRGKGYAVLAAWSGLFGVILYALGTGASMLLLLILGTQTGTSAAPGIVLPCEPGCATLYGVGTIITHTIGGGFLALATLFLGAVIARRGRNLWPGIWVAFSYMGLACAALFSGSAVEVATAPTAAQTYLSTPAILLFALWVLWLGIMLVRLKPES